MTGALPPFLFPKAPVIASSSSETDDSLSYPLFRCSIIAGNVLCLVVLSSDRLCATSESSTSEAPEICSSNEGGNDEDFFVWHLG